MPPQSAQASSKLADLDRELLADIDRENGGCRWWHGYQDWKRLAVTYDYLLQLVRTIEETAELASHNRENFAKLWTAHAFAYRQAKSGVGFYSSPSNNHRRLEIAITIRSFFDVSAQSLDLVATLLAGVAGAKTELRKGSWSLLARMSKSLGQRQSNLLDTFGTAGRGAQEAAVRACMAAVPTAPDGWLEWSVDIRNMLLHRAQRMTIQVDTYFEGGRKQDSALCQLLPANPHLSDAESFGHSRDISDVNLLNHAGDLIAMVNDNINSLLASFCEILIDLWIKRRNDPTLIVQPGQQWPIIEQLPATPFGGSECKLVIPTDGGMAINPRDGARFDAAKLMDDEKRNHWGR